MLLRFVKICFYLMLPIDFEHTLYCHSLEQLREAVKITFFIIRIVGYMSTKTARKGVWLFVSVHQNSPRRACLFLFQLTPPRPKQGAFGIGYLSLLTAHIRVSVCLTTAPHRVRWELLIPAQKGALVMLICCTRVLLLLLISAPHRGRLLLLISAPHRVRLVLRVTALKGYLDCLFST